MTHGPLLSLVLLGLASSQEPGPAPPAAVPARAAVAEDRIVLRAVAPQRDLVAGFDQAAARVLPRPISIGIDGKVWRVEDRPASAGEEAGDDPIAWRGAINLGQMALASDNFDRLICHGRPPDELRRTLHAGLTGRIATIGRTWPLGDDERRALELAGTGDIERFLNRVEAARREFEATRFDFARGRVTIERLAPLADESEQGPFGRDSLFLKTLNRFTVKGLYDPLRIDPLRLEPTRRILPR